MKSRGKKKDSYPLRRSKAYDRNLKNFKLLVAYEPFQDDVRILRLRLRIDQNGNLEDNSKVNWVDWAEKEGADILNSKRFIDQEAQIHKQFVEGKIGQRQRNRQMRLWYSKAPMLDLDTSIEALIEKYHLPLNYKQAIKLYTLSGDIGNIPEKNWKPNSVPFYNDKDKARTISVTIFSHLAKDEVAELNDYIEWIGKNNLPKYRDFTRLDVALQLKKNRAEKYTDDMGKEKKPSHTDLAEEYLGDKSKTSRARGIIRDLQSQQKRRFSKRAKK